VISIITDSTCDIPDTLIEEYGIVVVPLTIIWGDEQYKDRVDLQPEEFYKRLAVDPRRPTTAQAGIPDFQQAYEKAAAEGADEILCITISSAMSGTYNMAVSAAENMKTVVHVVDSKGPTMTLGWQVLEAARGRAAGLDVHAILARLETIRKRMVQLVAMDTLEYLQRGGRIGKAVKWVGVMMNVKPLVSINHVSGLVEPVSLARTQKALIETMYNKFYEMLQGRKNMHVAVLHGNALAKAEELAERIRKEYNPVELLVNITGPVLGVNTGPGALALCGYAEI
jgi:DegV family protein with EDD domain